MFVYLNQFFLNQFSFSDHHAPSDTHIQTHTNIHTHTHTHAHKETKKTKTLCKVELFSRILTDLPRQELIPIKLNDLKLNFMTTRTLGTKFSKKEVSGRQQKSSSKSRNFD